MTRTTRLHQAFAKVNTEIRRLRSSDDTKAPRLVGVDGTIARLIRATDERTRLERLIKVHGCLRTDSRWSLVVADDLAVALSFPMALGMVA